MDSGEHGIYNPRQDLNPSQRNSSNLHHPSGIMPLERSGPWAGGNGGIMGSSYDNFYGGPHNQNSFDGNSSEGTGFYNSSQNNYGNMNNSGREAYGGDMHSGGIMSGAPIRNNDPRTNSHDLTSDTSQSREKTLLADFDRIRQNASSRQQSSFR